MLPLARCLAAAPLSPHAGGGVANSPACAAARAPRFRPQPQQQQQLHQQQQPQPQLQLAVPAGPRRHRSVRAEALGDFQRSGGAQAPAPSPAETARTVLSVCSGGTLATVGEDTTPIGTPVSYTLTKEGVPLLQLAEGGIELTNIARNPRCSIKVQPAAYPARALASVTLVGELEGQPVEPGSSTYQLNVEKCLYFGGLDQVQAEISGEELRAAAPDELRNDLQPLLKTWNDERVEDIYRIVSHHLDIPLEDMSYAELLWVDHLGMYVRVEVSEQEQEASIVRVPFYRPVLDERDARSIITMASQLAWEEDRPYTPPVPSIFVDAAAAANN